MLSITSTPGRTNPSTFTTAALGPARARGENSKPGRTIRPKVDGGLTTGACWAPWRCTGTRELLHGKLDPTLGAYVGLEGGGTYVETQHRAADGQQKVNGGHATGACWAPRAVHRDRWLHCTCYFNPGPTWMPSRPPARQIHSGFGEAVLNCMQEFKNRLSEPHQAFLSVRRATCWRLFPLFNSGPLASLWKLCYWFIYMMNSEVYVPSCSLWGRELGQQVLVHMLWLFSQDFLKGSRARRRQRCRNVAWLHLAWAGVYCIILLPPHPPVGHARTHASFGLRVSRCWWRAARWLHLVHGGLASPHPSIGLRTCATIRQYNFQFSIIISNLNVKSEFQTADRYVSDVQNHILYLELQNVISNSFILKFNSLVTSSYLCLRTQLAMSISP